MASEIKTSVLKSDVCPICDSHRVTTIRKLSEPPLSYEPNLIKCRQCGVEFLSPPPSPNQLDAIYKDYFVKRNSGASDAKERFFKSVLEGLSSSLDGKKVLEIGGGEGFFARALRSHCRSAKLTVVEPNISPLVFSDLTDVKVVSLSLEEFVEHNQESFDYIFLFDVIEHLVDPLKCLSGLRAFLSKSGRLIASFPEINSSSRALLGRLWPQYKLEHLFYFTRESIEQLGQKSGLRTESYKPLQKTLPFGYELQIGSEFGPSATRAIVRAVKPIFPAAVAHKQIKINFGESLWVASAEGTK